MQHDNVRNLNRVNFSHWKHKQSRVNAFWYWFPVIKRYISLFDEIDSHSKKSEMLQLFDIWRYQSLVMLFFSSVVILI